jgi:threonine synthase
MRSLCTIKCSKCNTEYPQGAPSSCPKCGGQIEISYDYESIAKTISRKTLATREPGVWRYGELLPLRGPSKVTMGEGGTRLVRSERLAKAVGLHNLFIKNETENPTGSFKDRCSTVSISKVVEARAGGVVIASSGNAAASACAYSTMVDIPCHVLVPPETSVGKLVRISIFGGRVLKVVGPVDNCISMAEQISKKHGWMNVTTNSRANPYALEGTKTASYEIAESLGWHVPDYLALPVGGGACFTGHWKGFRDLLNLGFIERKPHLIAVQSEGCAPFASAVRAEVGPENIRTWDNPRTIASGITDAYPIDGGNAYRALQDTGGLAETVSDDEIVEAQVLLARKEGIFSEPTGAVSLAGLIKLFRNGDIDAGDVVACEITGHGLNDIEPTAARIGKVPEIRPILEDFERALASAERRN